MDVTHNTDRLFYLYQICLCLKELQNFVEKTNNLFFFFFFLSDDEILDLTPVRLTVCLPELLGLQRLVDDLGALGISQLAVGKGVRQQTEALFIICFHHFIC